jgi:hypothetical protein
MSEENSATAFGNNTGVLPPQAEETANFENVNSSNNNSNNSNSAETPPGVPEENAVTPLGAENTVNAPETAVNAPETAVNQPENTVNAEENTGLGNIANVVPVPVTAEPSAKPKRAQSAKQQATLAAQAAERASLKEAGVKKPTVATVATLAAMKARSDPNYDTAFANATQGRPLNSYRTGTAKKSRKATVTNTTVARNNSAAPPKTAKKSRAKNTGFATQTNLLGTNLPNTGAMNAKVDSIMSIAGAISAQVKELMHLAKTLKSKRTAPRNNTVRVRKPKGKKTATTNALGFGNLPVIPEESEQQLGANNNATYFNQLR